MSLLARDALLLSKATQRPFPRILHQTWETTDIPEKWKFGREQWVTHHPSWTHVLWTNEERREFLSLFGTPEDLKTFDTFPHKIQQIDFIRYFWLQRYGGVYSDLDLYPAEPIDPFFVDTEADLYVLASANMASFLTNSFLVSKPRIPFWELVIGRIRDKSGIPWWAIGKHLTVMCTTGPHLLTRAVRAYPRIVALLPPLLFFPEGVKEGVLDVSLEEAGKEKREVKALLISTEGGSWHSWDTKVLNFLLWNRRFLLVCVVVMLLFLCLVFGALFWWWLKH